METLRALHRLGQLESPGSAHHQQSPCSPCHDLPAYRSLPDDASTCKRRIDFENSLTVPSYSLSHIQHPYAQQQQSNKMRKGRGKYQTPAVLRRNERERNRVKMVNTGFNTLRQHVPQVADNKKISKVDTLRAAVEYIKQLQELLGDEAPSPVKTLSLGSPSHSGFSSDPETPSMDDDLSDFAPWF